MRFIPVDGHAIEHSVNALSGQPGFNTTGTGGLP
jgi:hypothetical protein